MAAVLAPDGAVATLEQMRNKGKVGGFAFAIRGPTTAAKPSHAGASTRVIHDDFSLIRRRDEAIIEEEREFRCSGIMTASH
jgi:hypothetical protein